MVNVKGYAPGGIIGLLYPKRLTGDQIEISLMAAEASVDHNEAVCVKEVSDLRSPV
jgi:hypothetical protein